MEPGKNTGVLLEIRPTDFRVGGETAIVYEVRLASGDWEKYRPTDEWQRRLMAGILGYDTLSCVTFSALRCVAMQIEFLIETGQAPDAFVLFLKENGYIDENGKVNFNEHFTAVMSGTTTNGNSGVAVWDSIRKDGLLAQSAGPAVNDFTTTEAWLANTITQAQKDAAKKILEWLTIQYEWVALGVSGQQANFAKHLKQAPLHYFTPVCPTWNSGEVSSCGRYILDHATSGIAILPDLRYTDLDHYVPFIKHLAADYYVPYAIKGLVRINAAPTTAPAFTHTYTVSLTYGMRATAEVRLLQQGLQTAKDSAGKPYMTPGLFGIYGTATRAAVDRFQRDHGIIDPVPGEHFGPQTRAALTAALLKN